MIRCWNCEYLQLAVHRMSDRCFPWKSKTSHDAPVSLLQCPVVPQCSLGTVDISHIDEVRIRLAWKLTGCAEIKVSQISSSEFWGIVGPARDRTHRRGRPGCKVFGGNNAKGRNDSKYGLSTNIREYSHFVWEFYREWMKPHTQRFLEPNGIEKHPETTWQKIFSSLTLLHDAPILK